MATEERIVSFEVDGSALHGVLHLPDESSGRLIVFCEPFAEEAKCARRPLVDVARAVCAEGCSVLRFSYRGCGDSEGSFADFAPEDWARDISAAADFGLSESGARRVGIAGLRMGASLADQVARTRDDVDCLILWEPVIDGKKYVRQNLRRSLIKAMLTDDEGFDAETVKEQHAGSVVEFDGYEVSARAMSQLEAINLGDAAAQFTGQVFILNIGPKDEPADAFLQLAAQYENGVAEGIRLQPFWNRIGLIEVDPLIAATTRWLRGIPAG